jgi:hypothetical protein
LAIVFNNINLFLLMLGALLRHDVQRRCAALPATTRLYGVTGVELPSSVRSSRMGRDKVPHLQRIAYISRSANLLDRAAG